MLGMFKQELRLTFICFCGEFREPEKVQERLVTIRLFGGVMANLCPSCYRVLDKDEREEVHAKWAEIQAEDEDDDDSTDP